jgi:phage repressor protein C with HTH and peptisase S24 domain
MTKHPRNSTDNGGDAVRIRLLELAQNSGASLSSLSELISRNTTYLQQFIRKGSPKKLEEQDRKVLAQFFGVDETELGGPVQEKSYYNVETPSNSASFSAAGRFQRQDWIEVPRIDFGASAGPGAQADDERVFDAFRFSKAWLREQGLGGAQLSAIAVKGDSMEPLLRDGDEILVDVAPAAFRDGVHVVRLGDSLMVKRVAQAGAGRFALISQNLAYPPIDVSAEECAIIGRVVWKSGRL